MSEGKSQPIRILIIHDHKLIRQGLCMLIERRADMRVVGEAGVNREALALAGREKPDIILMDLDFGGVGSLDLLPELRKTVASARILILTGVRDTDSHKQAVLLGALGVVMKDQSAEVLLRAIERVHSGEAWLNHSMAASVITQLSRQPRLDEDAAKIASLTGREREIISIVCRGLKNSQVATQLFISEATVRNHLTSILNKLVLSDRFELALYSYNHGLARPPDFGKAEQAS